MIFIFYISSFFSSKIFFSECNCQNEGSKSLTCDKRYGMCGCKSNIIGDKCDKCIDGFFGFPNCQSKWFLFSIFHAFPHQINHFQAAIVKTRDQRV